MKKANYQKTLLLILVLLLPAIVGAHDFEVDGIYYNKNGNEATVTYKGSYSSHYSNEYSGSVVIPPTVTFCGITYSVTKIGGGAFYNCTELTSISIPNLITSISESAFRGCTGLTSISIPNSVISIGDNAFNDCTGLTSINMGNSVTSIGDQAFYGCSGLTSIVVAYSNPYFDSRNNCNAIIETANNSLVLGCKNTIIPNTVTSIGQFAFTGCTSLTSIDIPNSVVSIGGHAFEGTAWFDNQPDGLVYAGLVAYKYKSTMPNGTSISLEQGTLGISDHAFHGCAGLTSIDIPNSVIEIGDEAFSYCTGLTSIIFSNSVNNIGEGMFYGCTGLTSISIPNSVTSIGEAAFRECMGLTSIDIPNSVTSIGSNAFYQTAWYENQPDGLVYAGMVAYKYKGTMPRGTSITLKEGTLGIAEAAFSGCAGLTSISIPNSVTSIGNGAFYLCGLTSIDIPNSVISIGVGAFGGCTGLTSINIGNSITSIGWYAFSDPLLEYTGLLTSIYCFAVTPPDCISNNGYDVFSQYSATLHVPAASLAAYFTAPVWCKFENIVGDAVAPTEISISKDSMEVQLGELFDLTATVSPANASIKEVTWYSTDTTVAIVKNGAVTPVDYGECDIVATCFGMQAICHVSVGKQLKLDQQEAMLLPNHMLTLTPTATVMPNGFTATSSDPTVAAARVVSGGKIQVVGIKEGTTTITVGSADGTAFPATCHVTVYTEPGDLNSDGFVTISDVTSLIDYLLSADDISVTTKNADVNGDGRINIADVTSLIDKLLSGTTDKARIII